MAWVSESGSAGKSCSTVLNIVIQHHRHLTQLGEAFKVKLDPMSESDSSKDEQVG